MRAYSEDLRRRVIQAALSGLSARRAAERFGVGVSTAIVWVRRFRETGEEAARRQGNREGSKLDLHADFILDLVEERKDISLAEIAERVGAERGVSACPATIWQFFDKRGMTYKKRQRMRPSSSART
jgi:transposase